MSETELAKLIANRGQIKARLTRLRNFFQGFDETTSDIIHLRLRLEKFESSWTDFDTIQSQIEIIDSSATQIQERESFESSYFDLVSSIQNFMQAHEASTSLNQTQVSRVSRVKLPTIQISPFDGSYENWLTFHDTFNSLIDSDDSLSDIQKFHYLRSSLKGEAANLIQSLETSAVNYKTAWDLLNNRYQNKRVIVQKYIKALFNIAPIHSESALALRNLSDELNKIIRALNALQLPTEHWDILIIYLVTGKLDNVTNREWETHIQSQVDNDLPTLTNLLNFIMQRCCILEALNQTPIDSTSQNKSNKPTVSHVASQIICPFCKESHLLYSCRELLKLPVPQRISQVKALKLCLNCLKSGHFLNKCSSGTCRKCKEKHNTILHIDASPSNSSPQSTVISGASQIAPKTVSVSTSDSNCNHASNTSTTILATALVDVLDIRNIPHTARVLLDSGSQSSFITETFCQRLGLRKQQVNIPITGIGQSQSKIKSSVMICIWSRNSNFVAQVQCFVLSKITHDLPHHPVVKIDGDIHKLRVVFDASSQASSGKSLNDILMTGPTIQPDLFSILCRFRRHRYVFISDIIKMYRQIRIDQSFTDCQRIFWRSNTNMPIQVYRLTTVTYGTSCAPFLAIRSLQQLAHENKLKYPRTSQIILDDFYVDDVLTGANSMSDLISRGLSPQQLLTHQLWWSGPSFLKNNSLKFPVNNSCMPLINIPENKGTRVLTSITQYDYSIFERYSSLHKLLNVCAYCLRFINNSKRNPDLHYSSPFLSATEKQTALLRLITLAQRQTFDTELTELKMRNKVGNKSKIHNLMPFLDSENIIRVGGRLNRAHIHYNQKHPIILPSRHPLTLLILKSQHIAQLHAGPQSVLATIRLTYWPINAKRDIKYVINKCVTCSRANPKMLTPIMGNLPPQRLEPARPFCNTGVDYCGPVYLVNSKLRKKITIKAYIAIFICLATKAVHIELVSDLSTDAFISALRRFIARRGKCTNLYSDNGTNFVGANRELTKLEKQYFKQLLTHNANISNFLADCSISWHFIPPRAPHFGGLWEAAVKSCKYHLRRVAKNALFTFEEMYTLLNQIEACLNSRPITPISDNPSDLNALTPGHFLMGDSPSALLEPNIAEIKENRLSRWQRIQQHLQHFWDRWKKEYLSSLQQRPKWRNTTPNIQPGTMVIIHDEHLPPTKWHLGRVVDVHPGDDGTVRVVTVRTAQGLVKRPVVKLSPLPMEKLLQDS